MFILVMITISIQLCIIIKSIVVIFVFGKKDQIIFSADVS